MERTRRRLAQSRDGRIRGNVQYVRLSRADLAVLGLFYESSLFRLISTEFFFSLYVAARCILVFFFSWFSALHCRVKSAKICRNVQRSSLNHKGREDGTKKARRINRKQDGTKTRQYPKRQLKKHPTRHP